MKTKAILALFLSTCVFLPALAQTKKAGDKSDDDDVVRITTNLVQIDAVVTKDGKVVPNLSADDFEIYQDGRKQTITSFAYISNVPATQPADATRENRTNVPFVPFDRDKPHRTIAFVVDDLGLSFDSIYQVRRHLHKFITEQMQPNDLVAIIRTGGELGALQQFTTDKRLLTRAVDQLRWNFCSRLGIQVFRPLGTPPTMCGPERPRMYHQSYNNALKSLRYIIDAMGQLPGRKSLVIMSDDTPGDSPVDANRGPGGLKAASSPADSSQSRERLVVDTPSIEASPLDQSYGGYTEILDRISEKAVRASVVIYSIDTRGLAYTGITAADSIRGNSQTITQQIENTHASRSNLLLTRREGSEFLARQTGGFQIRNSNNYQLERILEDQSGYYLLGYRPTEETFDRRFHHIKATVKRSGMTVRTRYGFFGLTEVEVAKRRQLTPADLSNLALASPFAPQDIEFTLTPFFAEHRGNSSLIRSFVNLELKGLTFVPLNGQHYASIEIHGVVFGDNGSLVQQLRHGATLRFSDDEYHHALQNGFQLSVDLPVQHPGYYQVRVAVRDRRSSKIGSAGGFVAVPNLKNKQLAPSGIVLGTAPESSLQSGTASEVMNPGTRRFRTKSDLYFAYRIYNSAIDSGSQLRHLFMETKLFRDDTNVFSGAEVPIVAHGQQDVDQVIVNGVVPLSQNLEPGNYYLQVVIKDKSVKNKVQPVVQWIDFEIVE